MIKIRFTNKSISQRSLFGLKLLETSNHSVNGNNKTIQHEHFSEANFLTHVLNIITLMLK
jgi:hypothetical protein